MASNTNEEKLQEKYVLYQLLQQNLEALKQQMQIVETQLVELRSTMQLFDDIDKLDESNEILIPLGSGCYGEGKLKKTGHVLVNIGAGVMINKKIDDARKFLEEREKELEKLINDIGTQMQKITDEMNVVALDIQTLSQKIK